MCSKRARYRSDSSARTRNAYAVISPRVDCEFESSSPPFDVGSPSPPLPPRRAVLLSILLAIRPPSRLRQIVVLLFFLFRTLINNRTSLLARLVARHCVEYARRFDSKTNADLSRGEKTSGECLYP